MLDGWYCRSLANEQGGTGGHSQQDDDENEPNVPDSGSDDSQDQESNMHIPHPDYKQQIKYLKQKFKFLLYENEFFQDALRTSQRRLLKVSRDRSFLLDRLLQYEKPEGSSSESEETESSDDERSKIQAKKRKYDTQSTSNKNQGPATKKKKTTQQKQKNSSNANQSQSQQQQHQQLQQQQLQHQQQQHQSQQQIQEGHMTAEEVERHLQSRQSISELMPERAPPTVPTEMFSNEPSLDSESNDQVIETSPSNIGEDCVSVSDMNVKNEFIKTEFIKTEFIKTEYQS